MRGTLLVISGPSGAGKGTLCNALCCQSVRFSVSATTRKPRKGEEHGVHYDFVSDARFDQMVENGEFLEHACIFGKTRYGTPRRRVEQMLGEGIDVLLDIDVQGAMNVKKSVPEAVLVFVLPPSFGVLEQRLRKRGTEDEETVLLRLKTAREEVRYIKHYDYLVINDEVEKRRCAVQSHTHGGILPDAEAVRTDKRELGGKAMIIYPPIHEMLEQVDCRYSLVVMVAKRARQLVAGDAPLIEVDEEQKPVTTAVNEIYKGKVSFERNGRM